MLINPYYYEVMPILSASGMHLSKRSRSASNVKGAKIRGAAEAVLGTDDRGQNSVYDTRSGTLLTIVLLFGLGWIPMIGQMVAGFVGGRRSGSPYRGFIAALFGTLTVVATLFLIVEGLKGINAALINDPEGEIAVIASSHPLLQQFLEASLGYARALFGNADFTISYATYAITIPFGVIGGIFADQAQKETRLIVSRTAKVNERSIRSIAAYKDGKSLGFETFEQYSNMTVNSMSAPVSRPVQEQKSEVPASRMTVRVKETPVTATVDTSRVQSSPTTSIDTPRKKEETESEATVYI